MPLKRSLDLAPTASPIQPSTRAAEQPYVLSQTQVCHLCGFSASHLDRLRKSDPSFPKPLILGPRRIGWLQEELLDWLRHSARRADEKGRPISADQPPGSADRAALSPATVRRLHERSEFPSAGGE